MKKILSLIAAMFSLFFLLIALALNPSTNAEGIKETIAKNRTIETVFLETANYVDEFNAVNARLPTADEFEGWSETQPKKWPSTKNLFLETNPTYIQHRLYEPYYDIDKTEDFGIPPDGSYILGLWRGEWFEYYISWKSTTTMSFQAADYYMFGSALKDFLFVIFLFLISTITSIWLWLSSNKAKRAVENG